MKKLIILISVIAFTGCATTGRGPVDLEAEYLAEREVYDAFNRTAWGYWRSWK
jgi:hypothetical protein